MIAALMLLWTEPGAVGGQAASDRSTSRPGHLAVAQPHQRVVGLALRHGGDRQRRQRSLLRQFHQFPQLLRIADVGALHGQRADRHQRQRHREFAAEQPDLDQLAALAQRVEREARGLRAVHQVDHREHRAAGGLDDALRHAVAAAVHHLVRAGLQRRLALLRADVDHDDVLVLHRAQHGDRIQPEAAGADHDDRLIGRDRHRLADRRIDGDAGARIGRRHRRIERAGIDQVPRMRRDHMRAVAAIGIDAETARREAHVVLLRQAFLAGAAAEPGEHDAQVADLHALGVGAELGDAADDLVSHRERQHDAAILQRHLLAAADVVVALPDVQVGVADAAMRHLDQHLGALRLRRRQFEFLQRLAILDHGPGAHRRSPVSAGRMDNRRRRGVKGSPCGSVQLRPYCASIDQKRV